MTSSEFKSAILEWYHGEIFGEVFFNELLANTVEHTTVLQVIVIVTAGDGN